MEVVGYLWHCRKSSILGLFPLDAGSTTPPISCVNQKYLQTLSHSLEGKVNPTENYCSRREGGVRKWPRAEYSSSKGKVRKKESTLGEMGVTHCVTVYKEGFGDQRGLGSGERFLIFQEQFQLSLLNVLPPSSLAFTLKGTAISCPLGPQMRLGYMPVYSKACLIVLQAVYSPLPFCHSICPTSLLFHL